MVNSNPPTKRSFRLSVLSVLAIWLLLWTGALPLSAQDVPPEVKAAAEQGYRSLLDAIPSDALSHFNFTNAGQVKQATLGEGFRVHTIPPESILAYDGKASVHELMVPTSIWFFPVISEGQARTLITVDKVGSGYKAVSIGGSGLALQWAGTRELYSSGGHERVFVRVYQATADFVVISDGARTRMAPLGAAMMQSLKDAGGSGLYEPSDIITGLRGPVKTMLDAARP